MNRSERHNRTQICRKCAGAAGAALLVHARLDMVRPKRCFTAFRHYKGMTHGGYRK